MRKAIFAGFAFTAVVACGAPEETAATQQDTEASAAQAPDTADVTAPAPAGAEDDVLVPGTDYSATTILDCGFDNKPPTQDCNAGIKRNWEGPGKHLIEVMKPDGRKRAIFFNGLEPYGADSAQADGSAAWELSWTRKDDMLTVRFGPETYVIVDAMIEGG